MNNQVILFTDGSVNPQSKIGYGAYLAVADIHLSVNSMKDQVFIKRFEDTSSTKLELQTLLWALEDIKPEGEKVIIYTDSQNIIGLLGRRERFEKNNYYSKNGKRIANFELYQEFFRLTDQLNCRILKVKGHNKSIQKENTDKLFTLVDRASRKALRDDAFQNK